MIRLGEKKRERKKRKEEEEEEEEAKKGMELYGSYNFVWAFGFVWITKGFYGF